MATGDGKPPESEWGGPYTVRVAAAEMTSLTISDIEEELERIRDLRDAATPRDRARVRAARDALFGPLRGQDEDVAAAVECLFSAIDDLRQDDANPVATAEQCVRELAMIDQKFDGLDARRVPATLRRFAAHPSVAKTKGLASIQGVLAELAAAVGALGATSDEVAATAKFGASLRRFKRARAAADAGEPADDEAAPLSNSERVAFGEHFPSREVKRRNGESGSHVALTSRRSAARRRVGHRRADRPPLPHLEDERALDLPRSHRSRDQGARIPRSALAGGPGKQGRRVVKPDDTAASIAALLRLPGEVARISENIDALREELRAVKRAVPPALVSVPDAARALGVSVATVRRRIADRSLPSTRVGRAVRVNLEAVTGECETATLAYAARDTKAPRKGGRHGRVL